MNAKLLLTLLISFTLATHAQIPPSWNSLAPSTIQKSELTHYNLTPQRIVWTSDRTGKKVLNPQSLLNNGIERKSLCRLIREKGKNPALLIDFGTEIQGGIQLTTANNNTMSPRVRICFGESVSEAMSNIEGDSISRGGATNHHSMRDYEVRIPGYGTFEVGNTGFRFVRIELTDTTIKELVLKEVRAVAVMRNLTYLGSFSCNDSLLNKIWLTGAYTVQLNMQEYLWDGIKRDRMVWMGDLYPEIMTINSVFGYQQIVPKSLDLVRNATPLPKWMNGISSYSMWWILIQHNWFQYQGDTAYLKEQQPYMTELLDELFKKVDSQGRVNLDVKGLFLDWPSSTNPQAIQAGMQALMVMSFEKAANLLTVLEDESLAQKCLLKAQKIKEFVIDPNGSKQAAALLAMAGIMTPENVDQQIITPGGAKGFSAFMGYYMLQAQAMAGNYEGALNNIREFWGGMIKMGATTMWEEFNVEWMPNAVGITDVVPKGKKDIHKDFGDYCFKNLRNSLCHGWSSGPTPWLSQYVLGITPLEPGCKTVRIDPHLGDLQWVEGTFPTPYGQITVRHEKKADGNVTSWISAPKEVKIIRN